MIANSTKISTQIVAILFIRKKYGRLFMAVSYENLLIFAQRNRQLLLGLLVALLLIAGGIYYYIFQYRPPIIQKAYERLAFAEEYFRLDSLDIALNGRGSNMGLLGIIKEYGNTPAGNLAHYYAGIICLRQHKFQQSLQLLRNFKPSTDLLKSRTHALLGDIQGELGVNSEAYQEYTEAAKYATGDDEFVAENLFRAARIIEAQSPDKALEKYQVIRNSYAKTQRAKHIDKYIARLQN